MSGLAPGTTIGVYRVARLLGMRSEEEWAAERTPARVSAHRWRMAVVWALLAIAALVTWLAPEYH